MGEIKFSFFIMDIILLLVFLGLLNMIFNLHKFFFVFELIIVLILVLLTAISIVAIYNNTSWGWTFLFFILGFILLDILFIFYMTGRPDYFFPITLMTSLGFLIAAAKIKDDEKVRIEPPKKVEKPVSKEFKPGKYVASKTGKKYHIPKCDWAKRIKKSNQVWFDSEAEAKKKGYKADVCLKNKVYKNF